MVVLLKTTLAPAMFHSIFAFKQQESGFHRTQTCVSTSSIVLASVMETHLLKICSTLGNMAGIRATCGYNWASRGLRGWGLIYYLLTPGISGPTRHTTHIRTSSGEWKCCFLLPKVQRKGTFFVWQMGMGECLKLWHGPLERFQIAVRIHENTKC